MSSPRGRLRALSRISGTFVIARSTAFTYKGKPADVKQIGRDLGVRYVLEGSEQHSGSEVRVNAQLIDAETGAHLWADQFDADRAKLLQMQDEIVTRIARTLEIQLSAVDATRVEEARPGNLDAEDLARRCKAGDWNAAPLSKEWEAAYALCARALQIDDRNVTACAGAHRVVAHPSGPRSTEPSTPRPRSARPRRKACLAGTRYRPERLLELTSPRPGVLLAQKIDTEEAIVQAERSLALNPSFMEAYEILCTGKQLSWVDRIGQWCMPTRQFASARADPYTYSAIITLRGGPSS